MSHKSQGKDDNGKTFINLQSSNELNLSYDNS